MIMTPELRPRYWISGLFSGAAVSARGAVVHISLQLDCKRSGIVTWVTGQRVDGPRLWFRDLVRCCSDYANLNFGQIDPKTPKSETSKVSERMH